MIRTIKSSSGYVLVRKEELDLIGTQNLLEDIETNHPGRQLAELITYTIDVMIFLYYFVLGTAKKSSSTFSDYYAHPHI